MPPSLGAPLQPQPAGGRQISLHRGTSNGDGDLREYDANGNLLHYFTYEDVNADSSEFRWRYKYDALDRRVNDGRERWTGSAWADWNSNTADTSFDLNGNVYRSYDKVNSGKFTERVYDDWQQLIKVKLPAVPNPAGGGDIVYETPNTYDVLGRRWKATDARGDASVAEFDQLGRTIKTTDAKGYETEVHYDTRGNRRELQATAGAVTTYTYNGRGLLATIEVDHDAILTPDTTTYTYDEMNRQTEVSFPDGGRSETDYDLLGRREETRTLLSGSDYLTTTYTYDLNNRVTEVTLPGAYTMQSVYDDLGNLTKMTDTNGDDTEITYDDDNRRKTETKPNALVSTWSYDWKTLQASTVLQELDTTSGNDITVTYGYNNNGQVVTIRDGMNQTWYKTYDAMGRMITLGLTWAGTHVFTRTLDGNGNVTKTVDFKGTSHYYAYDQLNRMTGHGSTSSADDELYDWGCCTKLVGYDDAFGTASLVYDDLARLTEHTDSQGNTVLYEYDEMSRVSKVTPAQGANYRTEYGYNNAGAITLVRIYTGGGSFEDTTYTYDTTSGKLLRRDFPTASGGNNRSTYSYDAGGRPEYETFTRETGSTQNLYRTKYEYLYLTAVNGGGRELTRIEQSWNGSAWVNENKLLLRYNAMEWLTLEQRWDWVTSAWSAVYDVNQVYDKNGNRTEYDKNVQGLTADYGSSYHLEYTHDGRNFLTAISNADDPNYSAAVTCDNNNNITQIVETITGTEDNHLYTYFDYDDLNRLTAYRTKQFVPAHGGGYWLWTKRSHSYDATGRLLGSNWKSWEDGDPEPGGDSLEHTYQDDGTFSQNYDGTSTYGEVWHWAGSVSSMAAPLRSRNADANTTAYNVGNNTSPQRRTINAAGAYAEQRNLWAQGRPMAKDSGQTAWSTGITSQPQNGNMSAVESRVFYQGTVAPTDMGHATDVRDRHRIGIFGTDLIYAGSYGRVNSETLGRDLNPLGRGDGRAYVAGMMRIAFLSPRLPGSRAASGTGFGSNNGGGLGAGGGGGIGPIVCKGCDGKDEHCFWTAVTTLMWPRVPQCCDDLCSPGEYYEDPEGCNIKMCKCIACGCRPLSGECLPENCDCFRRCGCNRYGSCKDNRCLIIGCLNGRMISGDDGSGDTRWDGGGGSSGVIIDSSCNGISLQARTLADILATAARSACNLLSSCECLHPDVLSCIQRICNGGGTIRIQCVGASSTCSATRGPLASATRGSGGCFGTWQTRIVLCIPRLMRLYGQDPTLRPSDLIHLLAHELLHGCDCNYGTRTSRTSLQLVDCALNRSPAVNPPGRSFNNPSRNADEAFAEACADACVGGKGRLDPYYFTNPNVPACCRCQTCYS